VIISDNPLLVVHTSQNYDQLMQHRNYMLQKPITIPVTAQMIIIEIITDIDRQHQTSNALTPSRPLDLGCS
jgi:hypothetical protein